MDLREAERRAIEKALRETDGNKAKTARRLGLTRTQLYVRLRKYRHRIVRFVLAVAYALREVTAERKQRVT